MFQRLFRRLTCGTDAIGVPQGGDQERNRQQARADQQHKTTVPTEMVNGVAHGRTRCHRTTEVTEQAREARCTKFANDLMDLEELGPLVNRVGSDSSSMDNMLELMVTGGIDLFRGVRMIIPPAWQNVETMDPDLRAFYEYNSMHMEPWDGPAGVVMTDGRYAVCLLDRNGLRPARWVTTTNGFITLASEIGVWNYKPEDVIAKGRVGPGQILAVDTETGQILDTDAIDNRLKSRHPYKQWLRKNALRIQATMEDNDHGSAFYDVDQLKQYMKMYQVTFEERDQVLRPLGEQGYEAVGSMGDDTPMAVLSQRVRTPYDYFRQQFAQVTNPPIDPLREAIVMSLEVCLGAERNIFQESPEHASRVILSSPVISPAKWRSLMTLDRPGFDRQIIDLNYDESLGLEAAVRNVADQAEEAVRAGRTQIVLTDRHIAPGKLPIHASLATGAVHHRLTEKGLRCDSNILVETATARDPHHFAVLIGFGASAVYPFLAYEVLGDLIRTGEVLGDLYEVFKNYRKGITKGLLKILSKMGISTVTSYRGAQLFEAIGLSEEVCDMSFRGVPSRIKGARFVDIEAEQKALAAEAWSARKPIQQGGLLKFVHGGEYHAYNPDVVNTLQAAVQQGDYAKFKEYTSLVDNRPVSMIRDLFKVKTLDTPLAISEIEPLESILKRFDSAGISLGALSPEAHEALAEGVEATLVEELRRLPTRLGEALAMDSTVEKVAELFADKNHTLFLGRGAQYPVAMEGSLKLKEISYIHAEAYPAGELKHGPLALVDDDMPVVTVAPNNELLEKLKSNLQEVRARGGQLIVFADEKAGMTNGEGTHVINMPHIHDTLSPILYTIPLQLLSYYVAVLKGTDVDQPRNLAKSVTVE